MIRLALKKIWMFIYPKPFGMKVGVNSIVMLPRRINGAKCIVIGDDTIVTENGWISAYEKYGDNNYKPQIIIGNGIRIGPNFMLTAVDQVVIEDGCLFSAQVFISDHTHGHKPSNTPPAKQPLVSKGPVHIGKHCFIGIRVSIMPGVSLGDYCVVGAHSVVTKSFPERSVIAGAPAKLIRTLPKSNF